MAGRAYLKGPAPGDIPANWRQLGRYGQGSPHWLICVWFLFNGLHRELAAVAVGFPLVADQASSAGEVGNQRTFFFYSRPCLSHYLLTI